MPDASAASGVLHPPHVIFDACIVIWNKILPEIQLYLTSISMLEDRIIPIKRSIYVTDPRRGFRVLRRAQNFIPRGGLRASAKLCKIRKRKAAVCVDKLEPEHFHEHTHDHADAHQHPHHENTKYVQNRLARASGLLQHVRAMVDSEEDCSDVLMQLSAVIGALQSIAKVILKDHLDHCVVDAVQSGDIRTLKTAIISSPASRPPARSLVS